MKTKSIFFGLAPLGMVLASNSPFLHLPFFYIESKLPLKPAQAQELILQKPLTKKNKQPSIFHANLNKAFHLKVGQTVIVDKDNNLTIKLVKVNDSRCPINARCIWAGEAVVSLTVVKPSQNQGEVVLTSKAGSPESAIKTLADNSTIKLIDVQPAPIVPSQVQQADYVVTLVVSKATTGVK